jgi:hypothetical protein
METLRGKVNNEDTDSLNYYFSQFFHREAMKSLEDGFHKFENQEDAYEYLYINTDYGLTHMGKSLTLTYGVNGDSDRE